MTITQTILMVIVQNGGNSIHDLREIFDGEYDRKQISNALHRLKADGLILLVSDSDGERLYMATDKGRSVAAELEVELESHDNAAEPHPTQPETDQAGDQVEAVPTTATPATDTTAEEALARRIRDALGEHNDHDKPLVECIKDLVAAADAKADQAQLRKLERELVEIRDAVGFHGEHEELVSEIMILQALAAAKPGKSNLEDQINEALGDFGDPAAPVVSRVKALRADRYSLYQNYAKLLDAAGDDGNMTYPMLLEHIRQNRRDAEEAREVRQYLNGFSDDQRSLTEIVSSLIDSTTEKITTQAAIGHLRSLISSSYDDEITIHIGIGDTTITAMDQEFTLNNTDADQLIQQIVNLTGHLIRIAA